MKAYRRVEVQLHAFLTLTLDGGEWSASHPGCFIPISTGEKAGWAPELVWMWWQSGKILTHAMN
jgi:hypothetical protein